jgi:transcriptional regulator with XRE-family HTH domain
MRKAIHSDLHQVYLALLKEARSKAGLTQAEVAIRLKRPQSFVAKYEGGERRLDVIEFLSVAQAIEADAVQIITKLATAMGARRRGPRARRRRRE